MIAIIAGSASAAMLIMIAMIHGYWALGGYWPGHDEESLARKVVGGPPGMRFPPKLATWGVAVALVGVAMTALGACGLLLPPAFLPASVVRGLTIAAAIAFGLRGVGGYFDARLRPDVASSPFVRLNLVLYSPLCVVLALLLALAARG